MEECVYLPEAHMEAFMVTLYLMEAIGPPQMLMHLWVRNLAQFWRWPKKDFPFEITCHFISLSLLPSPVRSLSFSTLTTSHLLTLCECILSCALSLSSHLPSAFFSLLVFLSLPVALQRKFNIGLFGVSKDSIRRSSGPYAKTNISCCGQEQQTSPHYPTMLIFAPPDLSVPFLHCTKSALQEVFTRVKLRTAEHLEILEDVS